MIKNLFSRMDGIEIYGVISICLFVAVFTGAMIWAVFQKKTFLKTMSALPLDEGQSATKAKGESHE